MTGQHLRAEREKRGWTRLVMAKKLREAADRPADVPCLDHLMSNIYRWERGRGGVSERYQVMYCRAFGRSRRELFSAPEAEHAGGSEPGNRIAGLPLSVPEGSGYVIFRAALRSIPGRPARARPAQHRDFRRIHQCGWASAGSRAVACPGRRIVSR